MRCGTKIYKGREVPFNAQIHEYQGRDCYLSGIENNEKIIRFIDTGEIKRFAIKK